ncbi:TetR/AcrR family transcriptional regulator [Stutzerimonas stutzeri]|uniref:TetR/AcrR family transcriptional regulator n=1 Tax=Stutzerimonas sp. S1 TaxID=3030652 RepID=UPI0022257962|nr:TetR/AcrR family transcriptional regulator [Stutzerimonas sp. S1]MCW3147502.1 TetR/AcrR family transcriptional regulator [Stutzerimonas sp. S1]
MAPRAKTRDRILDASLELFNAQGERNVTTNHIAAHLQISPGNLYYHFANKQAIIAELFRRYEARIDDFLRPPERALTLGDKVVYLEALLAAMWDFRFLHRDLEHLLEADAQLAQSYRTFAARCLDNARAIYQGFVDVGILQMEPAEVEALALNAWIIMTSWIRFLGTVGEPSAELKPELLRRGIYQLLALEVGFVSPGAAKEVSELLCRYLTDG